MPQQPLPIFPDDCTPITPDLAFQRCGDTVIYLNGHLPVFTHAVDDLASFRMFTSQLCINGSATQPQIVRAFGVPLTTVKRMCAKLCSEGAAAFFAPKPRREGSKLTDELLTKVQSMLDAGAAVPHISAELCILQTTLPKAIGDGRLKKNRPRPRSRLQPTIHRNRQPCPPPDTQPGRRAHRDGRRRHHGHRHHPRTRARRRRHGPA